MTDERSQSSSASGHDPLQERCRALGIPTWRFGPDGACIARPNDEGALGSWLRSGSIENPVFAAVAGWIRDDAWRSVRLSEGFWLVPIIQSSRRRRGGTLAAAVFGPEVLHSEYLTSTSSHAQLNVDAIREELRSCAVFPETTIERVAMSLSWSQSDLDAIARSQASIAEFSHKLAESYEEITLLQKLGRSMNQLAQPKRFVALACNELQKTLPFGWVAIRFSSERRLARSMAGRLHLSGEAPCDRTRLEHETTRLIEGLSPVEALVMPPESCARLGLGASQLLVHPVAREGQVVAAIFAGDKRGADPHVSSMDIKLLEAAAAHLTILLDNSILYDDQQLMFVGTLEALTSSIDAKDPYTCGHSERVAELAAALAAAHGLDDESIERIRLAGVVHDVGKIGVPEAVLCKTGRLTEDEFAQIKLHPEIGYQILKDIPHFEDLLPGVLYHHERYDGKGYPSRLRGEQIPLMARIIGLVDAFDAMSSNRTYRSAMARDRVLEELTDHAGSQFDPVLVESFRRVDLTRYDELVEKHQTDSASGQGGLRIRRTSGITPGQIGGLAA